MNTITITGKMQLVEVITHTVKRAWRKKSYKYCGPSTSFKCYMHTSDIIPYMNAHTTPKNIVQITTI